MYLELRNWSGGWPDGDRPLRLRSFGLPDRKRSIRKAARQEPSWEPSALRASPWNSAAPLHPFPPAPPPTAPTPH